MVELNNAFLSPQTHTAKQSKCVNHFYMRVLVWQNGQARWRFQGFSYLWGKLTGLKDISRQKNYTRKASRTVIIFAELSDVGIKASVLYMTNDLRVFQLTLLIITARLFQRSIPHLPDPTSRTNGATTSTNTSRASIKSTLYFIFC